ncbi:hypothetical protein ACO03V_00450 [Microbacterium sp. HMH0099]|uniref:hypothetical protein n=1 Tax=Microbacterium sp. HMH0099 TaxID=3414026 RepID=UPI003BF687F0
MGEQTMIRTQVAVNDAAFYLAQGQSHEELMRKIEEAVKAGGRFVTFTVVGNREVSVLFTVSTSVALSVETVQYDVRDNGELTEPFGGFFDA